MTNSDSANPDPINPDPINPEVLPAELTIQHQAQARALAQHHDLLLHFTAPRSPSAVAARLKRPANTVHHHVRRLTELELLREERRAGGRVYYVLTARQYRVPLTLLPPGDPDENAVRALEAVEQGFLSANARSWQTLGTADEDTVYGFTERGELPCLRPVRRPAPERSADPQPAHLDALTLRLTPGRYARLALALSELLTQAMLEGRSDSGEVCTLAVVGFARPDALPDSTARSTSTFLSADALA